MPHEGIRETYRVHWQIKSWKGFFSTIIKWAISSFHSSRSNIHVIWEIATMLSRMELEFVWSLIERWIYWLKRGWTWFEFGRHLSPLKWICPGVACTFSFIALCFPHSLLFLFLFEGLLPVLLTHSFFCWSNLYLLSKGTEEQFF